MTVLIGALLIEFQSLYVDFSVIDSFFTLADLRLLYPCFCSDNFPYGHTAPTTFGQ